MPIDSVYPTWKHQYQLTSPDWCLHSFWRHKSISTYTWIININIFSKCSWNISLYPQIETLKSIGTCHAIIEIQDCLAIFSHFKNRQWDNWVGSASEIISQASLARKQSSTIFFFIILDCLPALWSIKSRHEIRCILFGTWSLRARFAQNFMKKSTFFYLGRSQLWQPFRKASTLYSVRVTRWAAVDKAVCSKLKSLDVLGTR